MANRDRICLDHLIHRRHIVAIDEWLTYTFLLYLFTLASVFNIYEAYLVLVVAVPFALHCNLRGYRGLWALREAYDL